MSLQSRLTDLATRIATEFKTLRSQAAMKAGTQTFSGTNTFSGPVHVTGAFTTDADGATYTENPFEVASKGYLQHFPVRPACRVATTAAITLSGLQTIDGVAVLANNRVLVKNQADPTHNGVYIAKTGAWVRAADFASAASPGGGVPATWGYQVYGCQMMVIAGTQKGAWTVTEYPAAEIGTAPLVFSELLREGPAGAPGEPGADGEDAYPIYVVAKDSLSPSGLPNGALMFEYE